MPAPIRFWGIVLSVKPRLVLTKFEGQTVAKCVGHLVLIDGTQSQNNAIAQGSHFTVALGPTAREKREVSPGDLLRGNAHFVPPENPDTPADLYRVGTLRTIARQNEPGGKPAPPPDPPRTDPPLTPDEAEAAPRRALNPANLDETGPCYACPFGVVVPVVRLSDPRDYRTGTWSRVPACLGPQDCPALRWPFPRRLGEFNHQDAKNTKIRKDKGETKRQRKVLRLSFLTLSSPLVLVSWRLGG